MNNRLQDLPGDGVPTIVPLDDGEPSAVSVNGGSFEGHTGAGVSYTTEAPLTRSVGGSDGEGKQAKFKNVPEADGDGGEPEERSLPDVVDAAEWCEDPPPQSPAIIGGLLRKGAKMVLGGSSKSRKSWTLIQLALCVANGIRFLNMATVRSRVLYVNMELPDAEMCSRLIEVSAALSCGKDGLFVWNLRGHAQPLEELKWEIIDVSQRHQIDVIILDPIYKVLGDRCENANEDVADLLNHVDKIAEETEAAFIFAHHFAKGAQGGKFVEDRISGAGAWWRDPDAGIFMTPLEEEGGFNVTCLARSFPPHEEFAARAAHPLMVVADDLDPAKIRQPGPSKKVTGQQVVDLLPPDGYTYSDWAAAAERELNVSGSTFNRRKKEAERQKKITKRGGHYFQITS